MLLLIPSENPFKFHNEVLYLQPMIPSKRFDTPPLTGECSEGLDAFRIFFKYTTVIMCYDDWSGIHPHWVMA